MANNQFRTGAGSGQVTVDPSGSVVREVPCGNQLDNQDIASWSPIMMKDPTPGQALNYV